MNTNSINVDGKSYYTPQSKGMGLYLTALDK